MLLASDHPADLMHHTRCTDACCKRKQHHSHAFHRESPMPCCCTILGLPMANEPREKRMQQEKKQHDRDAKGNNPRPLDLNAGNRSKDIQPPAKCDAEKNRE